MSDELYKAYLYTFDTPHGKIVLEDLKEQYIDIARYQPHTTNGLDLAFSEGQRWVAMHIFNNIEQARDNVEESESAEHGGAYI